MSDIAGNKIRPDNICIYILRYVVGIQFGTNCLTLVADFFFAEKGTSSKNI